MGKLNYNNRKIEGLKLGQVVAKDLLKRIPPASGHKAALRDPTVDFDASGRSLSDESIKEIRDALSQVASYNGSLGPILKLEEFCVKGNELTAASLGLLADIVQSARSDLRDIDLSSNKITITTSEDAANLENFLIAIGHCCTIRRLDLSNNDLGSKAFEILTKVYARERHTGPSSYGNNLAHATGVTVDLTERDQSDLDVSVRPRTPDDEEYDEDVPLLSRSSTVPRDPNFAGESKVHVRNNSKLLELYKSETGIQSIPYIVLTNTGMNDTGAMYLSYVLAIHRFPEELLPLVPPVRAGIPAQQLEGYDSLSGCRGIIYQPNKLLKSAGVRVLDLAEQAREGQEVDADSKHPGLIAPPQNTPTSTLRRISDGLDNSPASNGVRRRSESAVSSPSTTLFSNLRSGELDRARSRIQGDTIRDSGVRSNALWSASLRMLSYARSALVETDEEPLALRTLDRELDAIADVEESASEPFPAFDFGRFQSGLPTETAMMSIPIATRNYGSHQHDLLSSPCPKPRHSAGVQPFTISSDIHTLTNGNGVTGHSTLRSESVQGPPLRFGLDAELWARILVHAADGEGIIDREQQLAIIAWAADRSTLEREMECLGKTESAQIWRVLDGMNCLTYGAHF